jgi:hypothetical protein
MKKPRLSFGDIGELIREALDKDTKGAGNRSPYIEAIYDDHFVYDYKGQTWKRTYTIVSEEKITLGKPEAIEEEYVAKQSAAIAKRQKDAEDAAEVAFQRVLNKCKIADKHLDPTIAVMEKNFRETVAAIDEPKKKLAAIEGMESRIINPSLVGLGLRER